MKLSAPIGFDGDPHRLAEQARNYEAAGIDLVWGAEIYGYDLVSTLGYVAAVTNTITLMTGIIPIYSRSPTLIAQTAATLDALSDGRFVLGIGASGPQVIEGWHGVAFDRPIARTRDTIDICRKVWSGDKVTHDGPTIELPLTSSGTGNGKALRFTGQRPDHDIPIAVAALGPANVRLTAATADLWQTIHFVPERFEDVWGDALSEGRTQRPAHLGPLEIMAGGIVAIGDGPHIDAARDAARTIIGFYVGGMGSRDTNFYNDLFCRYGWEDEADQVQQLFLSGKRDAAYAAIPDEYLDLATLIGDETHVRSRVEAYRQIGVTHLDLQPHGPGQLDAIAQIAEWAHD